MSDELKKFAEAAKRDQYDYAALNDYGMAASPAAILALIARAEAAEGLASEAKRLFVDAAEQALGYKRERDELRADAERWQHMRSSFVRGQKHDLRWYLPMFEPLTADGLDSAVDQARGAL